MESNFVIKFSDQVCPLYHFFHFRVTNRSHHEMSSFPSTPLFAGTEKSENLKDIENVLNVPIHWTHHKMCRGRFSQNMKSVQRFETRESRSVEDDVGGDDSILEFSLSSLC